MSQSGTGIVQPDQPPITLDTTLADLYAVGNNGRRIAMVLCIANSELALGPRFPRNKKYLFQDSTFSNTPEYLPEHDHEEAQRQAAVKYLSLIPQHDAFAAGNMPVILFSLDGSEEELSRGRREAEETFSLLTPSQRPHLLFLRSPADISLENTGIDLLAPKTAVDELEAFPLTINLETHYFLNSKAGLCTSGLPTPKCKLLEVEGLCPDARSCCSTCSSESDSLKVPSNCTGIRGKWLYAQVDRAISQISIYPLPFVFKNQETLGGGGTVVVSSPGDREKLIQDLASRLLPKLFTQVTTKNAHLKPATLILSDVVQDPSGDYGLTFFVTQNGEPAFIAVTKQTVDASKAWIGSKISYPDQAILQTRFEPIMRDIAAWLHSHKYYGAIGADILETSPRDPDGNAEAEKTSFHIVDLNVRTSGSLVLGLLGTHFSKQRQLPEASSFSVTLKMGRGEFVKMFASHVQEGRLIIVSWYDDVKLGLSFANLIVGAEDGSKLEREVAKIKECTTEIHF